jgi:hypothetical protein
VAKCRDVEMRRNLFNWRALITRGPQHRCRTRVIVVILGELNVVHFASSPRSWYLSRARDRQNLDGVNAWGNYIFSGGSGVNPALGIRVS